MERERGLTLIELLVVMAVLAMITMLAPAAYDRLLPSMELKRAATDMARDLRRAQETAVLNAQEASVLIDVANRRYRGSWENTARQLPKDTEVTLAAATTERRGQSVGGIRFFPDGGSTGGKIRLKRNGTAYDINVDWLLGQVTVERSDAS